MTKDRNKPTQLQDHLKAAARAHTDLNVFAMIVSMLENGHVYDSRRQPAAFEIIRICKREQQKCLRDYDRALDRASHEAFKAASHG